MRARPKPKRYLRKLQSRKPCVHGESGVELRPYQIILRPLVTEKGTHQSARYNSYSFIVNTLADKTQIKAAVEELFNVKVEKVRTQVYKGKVTRFRMTEGRQADWKKAIVTLDSEYKIEFY